MIFNVLLRLARSYNVEVAVFATEANHEGCRRSKNQTH